MQPKRIKRNILLSPLYEELYKSVKLAGEINTLGKKMITPTPVQVDFKFHRLAQNIFDTLHSEDGTRIDLNIWEFPTTDLAYAFIDTLTTLGVEQKHIVFPGSFVQYIEGNEEGDDKSIKDQLSDLEADLFGTEESENESDNLDIAIDDLEGELTLDTDQPDNLDQALTDLELDLESEEVSIDKDSDLDSSLSELEIELSDESTNTQSTEFVHTLPTVEDEDGLDELDAALNDLEGELPESQNEEDLDELDAALEDLEVELPESEEISDEELDRELEELAQELENSNV